MDLEIYPYCLFEGSNFNFRYVRLFDLDIPRQKMPICKQWRPYSDPAFCTMPVTHLGVSRLKWIKVLEYIIHLFTAMILFICVSVLIS